MMKEIHAYQNADGTYRVEILDTIEKREVRNGFTYLETTHSRTEIDKASIAIKAYDVVDESGKLATIML